MADLQLNRVVWVELIEKTFEHGFQVGDHWPCR